MTLDLFPGETQHWVVRAKSCCAVMHRHVPELKDQGQNFDGKFCVRMSFCVSAQQGHRYADQTGKMGALLICASLLYSVRPLLDYAKTKRKR